MKFGRRSAQQPKENSHESSWEMGLLIAAVILVALGSVALWWGASSESCTVTTITSGSAVGDETEECSLSTAEMTLVGLPLAAAAFLAIPFVMGKTGLIEAAGMKRRPPTDDERADALLDEGLSSILKNDRDFQDGAILPRGSFEPKPEFGDQP